MERSQKWELGFNESARKVLHLGSENERLKYQMGITMLEIMLNDKDLGVFIDEELKFHQHVAKAVNNISHLLGLVRATFICLDDVTVPQLFTTTSFLL